MSDEEAVQAISSKLVQAWNAHDMKAFAVLFKEDAVFVNVYGMWWTGRKRIHAEHAATHATVFRQSRLTARQTLVKFLHPDVASLHVFWELTGLTLPDGRTLPDRKGVLVFMLVKDSNDWQIAVGQNTDIAQPPM